MEMKQAAEVDIAYHILKEYGQAMYFRELITKVMEVKERPIHSLAHAMSEIHTQINMDSRFSHLGKGMWGLADWTPQANRRSSEEAAPAAASSTKRRERLLEEIQQDFSEAASELNELD